MRSKCFEDFDAFAASIHGIESKMMLRNPKRRTWMLSHVGLPGVDVQVGRLGSGNIAQGEIRQDAFLLYMPLTDGCEYTANGSVLDKNSFAMLGPGSEFCISTKVEHDWCAATVPIDMLADGVEPSSVRERAIVRVTQANRQLASQFRAIVNQVITGATICDQFESAPAASFAAADLLEVTVSVIGQPQTGEANREGRPRVPRREIIRRSKELLEQQNGQRVRVAELAAVAEVSERTLRTAFGEYFGVGPVRYLQLRQLHQVHRALQAADPDDVSVAEVLVAHGEWEFSRFAARYRRLFGGLPSETLRGLRR